MKVRKELAIGLCLLLVVSTVASPAVLASGTERNTLEYHLDYNSDFFDADTIHYTGTANYTQYKHVTSNSPYIYQGGTWVKTHKDNMQYIAGSNYWAGSKNHYIVIEESGDSASDLRIADERAYDDDDEQDVSKWLQYSFDVAWDLTKTYAPFYVPPKPPGIGVDSNEDTSIDTVSETETRIDYNEGTTDSGEQYTHSASWKWEFPYTVNSGWHWVRVDRQADNGYYQMDSYGFIHWHKEDDQQLALGTGFCIYRDSKSSAC